MTIKERIQALLRLKNISSVQMEKDLGFAKGYISKLDKASPSSENILRIANYLGVTTDSLLRDEDFYNTTEDAKIHRLHLYAAQHGVHNFITENEIQNEELIEYFNQLPPEMRKSFLDLAKATADNYKDKP